MDAFLDCLGIERNNEVFNSSNIIQPEPVSFEDVLDKLGSGWEVQELREDELGVLGASSRQITVLTWADTVKGIAAVLMTIAALGLLISLILSGIVAPLTISAALLTGISMATIEGAHRFQARAIEWVSRKVEELRNQIFLQMSA